MASASSTAPERRMRIEGADGVVRAIETAAAVTVEGFVV